MTTPLIAVALSFLAVIVIACGLYEYYRRRFLRRLRAHAEFSGTPHPSQWEVSLGLTPSDDAYLTELRETYRLEETAGIGSDQERAIRVMLWVHGLTRHSVKPSTPKDLSALNLIRLCQQQGKRINCWMYSIILNECLLSLGISSRMVHLLPPKERPNESHFVVEVYVRESGKWIMLDPDMRGYFMDEFGEVLGVAEIRTRLTTGEELRVSDTLNLQGVQWLPRRLLGPLYTAYISKNIFRVACSQFSGQVRAKSEGQRITYELIPDGYHREWLKLPQISTAGNVRVFINDAAQFWQPACPDRALSIHPD